MVARTLSPKTSRSRRNQLGPFYLAGGVRWPIWTGNAEMDAFATAPRRALVPFGLGTHLNSQQYNGAIAGTGTIEFENFNKAARCSTAGPWP